MYQKPNQLFDSGRKVASNNPFRLDVAGGSVIRSTALAQSSNSAFEDWVQKNKELINMSDDEDLPPQRPKFPAQSRTGSDSNVNYRYVLNL